MPHCFDEVKLTKAIHEGRLRVSQSRDYTWGDAAMLARVMMSGRAFISSEQMCGLFDLDEDKLMLAIRSGDLSLSPSGYPYSCTQAREEAQEMMERARRVWIRSAWD